MRKFSALALAVTAFSLQACAPQKCALEPRYATAREALERSTKAWKAGDVKAADRIAQDGIAKLGRDGVMDESDRWAMDHTSLRLLAAKDEERRGNALYALMDRRTVLMQRLAIYRDAHKCAD